MKESYLYEKLEGEKVQCQTCAHYCLVSPGERGKCGVRENRGGTLYALNYGLACALHLDPIEKKPLFHFFPGTRSLSVATAGCNFRCSNCQNWRISQGPQLEDGGIEGEELSPKELVGEALSRGLPSISYTYTEPTIFLEYGLDTMKLAEEENLKNAWITNGFLSPQALELISPFLDAANVDLKSFDPDFYQKHCRARLEPVLETLKKMKEDNVWLEVTTLVIPTLTDDPEMLREIAAFIRTELGLETPWHLTRFSGDISWKLKDLPDTPPSTLKEAYRIGKEEGLDYVYTGNVPGLETEDTFCPRCQELIIDRSGYSVKRHDREGKCPQCGMQLTLVLT